KGIKIIWSLFPNSIKPLISYIKITMFLLI
ncbi:hypothetical protein A5873_002510, partial [Enterococcus faecium]